MDGGDGEYLLAGYSFEVAMCYCLKPPKMYVHLKCSDGAFKDLEPFLLNDIIKSVCAVQLENMFYIWESLRGFS